MNIYKLKSALKRQKIKVTTAYKTGLHCTLYGVRYMRSIPTRISIYHDKADLAVLETKIEKLNKETSTRRKRTGIRPSSLVLTMELDINLLEASDERKEIKFRLQRSHDKLSRIMG